MLIKTTISGNLWNWYKYQGYMFKSDQHLTDANSIKIFMEPGQGELGTNLAELDRVLPSTLFAAGTLPEMINGKYITYIQPQYANWVNASDVSTWFESILPLLNIPGVESYIFALSLGGLASQYLSQANAKMRFHGAAFYDGFMFGSVPVSPANIVTNCANMLIVDDINDTTVDSSKNSQVLYNDIIAFAPAYPIKIVNLPGSAHDTWDHGFDPANKGADSFFQFLSAISAPSTVPAPVIVPVIVPDMYFTITTPGTYKIVKL